MAKPKDNTYVITVILKSVNKKEAKNLSRYIKSMTGHMRDDQLHEGHSLLDVQVSTAHVKDVK